MFESKFARSIKERFDVSKQSLLCVGDSISTPKVNLVLKKVVARRQVHSNKFYCVICVAIECVEICCAYM